MNILIKSSFKWIFIFALFLAIISLNKCKSAEISKSSENNSAGLIMADLRENYSPYNHLQGNFILKGKISGNTFTYQGKLLVENGGNYKFSMVVQDLIFFSPLITIDIRDSQLRWKDYMNNQEKSYPYTNSSILFFSDELLPADILIPLLTGNLPENMIKLGKPVTGKASLKYSISNYEVVGFFNNSILNTLICNPTEDFHQVVYKISGRVKNNKARYFPENIKILLENENYIEINYSAIDLK